MGLTSASISPYYQLLAPFTGHRLFDKKEVTMMKTQETKLPWREKLKKVTTMETKVNIMSDNWTIDGAKGKDKRRTISVEQIE